MILKQEYKFPIKYYLKGEGKNDKRQNESIADSNAQTAYKK